MSEGPPSEERARLDIPARTSFKESLVVAPEKRTGKKVMAKPNFAQPLYFPARSRARAFLEATEHAAHVLSEPVEVIEVPEYVPTVPPSKFPAREKDTIVMNIALGVLEKPVDEEEPTRSHK
eukprot:gnl/Chilomastix_cuspidata/3608.p1 GENE.gnl/Chilomastix_cuspidata/3608~~gnl/Chilomastix_cuspidata/3608.p1  ORF type:complete len:122 (-),score=14.51 gnl/Chilomastix_cuspidata/3608:99-464(-)